MVAGLLVPRRVDHRADRVVAAVTAEQYHLFARLFDAVLDVQRASASVHLNDDINIIEPAPVAVDSEIPF